METMGTPIISCQWEIKETKNHQDKGLFNEPKWHKWILTLFFCSLTGEKYTLDIIVVEEDPSWDKIPSWESIEEILNAN